MTMPNGRIDRENDKFAENSLGETSVRVMAELKDDSGTVIGVDESPVIIKGEVGYARELVDAFGRVRVSNPNVLFSSTLNFDDKDLFFTEKLIGSASRNYNRANACVDLTTTTASGDRAIRQSKEYMQYTAGQSFLVYMTGVFGDPVANCSKYIGFYDDDNGLYFREENGNFYAGIRTKTSGSVVNSETEKANFNIDKLDGSGPSGMTIDLTKSNIYVYNFEWLGVGAVWFGVVHNGAIYWCHRVDNNNVISTVYMSGATLPVRYEIENTGVTSQSTTLRTICSSVISEGAIKSAEMQRSISTEFSQITVANNALTPLISLRLDPNYARASLRQLSFQVMSILADNLYYEVHLNATEGTNTWSTVSSTGISQYLVEGNWTADGEVILSGYTSKETRQAASQFGTLLKLASDYDGAPDTMTVFAAGLGSTGKASASLAYAEVF